MTMTKHARAPSVVAPPCERDLSASHGRVFGGLVEAFERLRQPLSAAGVKRLLAEVDWERVALGETVETASESYVRTLLFRSDHVELLVMTWLPGQRSAVHDHAGSVCAVRVMQGLALERRYRDVGDGAAVACDQIELLEEGATTISVDDDIHSLGNALASGAPAEQRLVTVHIYSPPLRAMRRYAERA